MSMKNPLTPSGIEPTTFRLVAQHLKHFATAVPWQIKSLYLLCIGYSRTMDNCVFPRCFVAGLTEVFVLEINTKISKNIPISANLLFRTWRNGPLVIFFSCRNLGDLCHLEFTRKLKRATSRENFATPSSRLKGLTILLLVDTGQ